MSSGKPGNTCIIKPRLLRVSVREKYQRKKSDIRKTTAAYC